MLASTKVCWHHLYVGIKKSMLLCSRDNAMDGPFDGDSSLRLYGLGQPRCRSLLRDGYREFGVGGSCRRNLERTMSQDFYEERVWRRRREGPSGKIRVPHAGWHGGNPGVLKVNHKPYSHISVVVPTTPCLYYVVRGLWIC